jgi:hypothetical protein
MLQNSVAYLVPFAAIAGALHFSIYENAMGKMGDLVGRTPYPPRVTIS